MASGTHHCPNPTIPRIIISLSLSLSQEEESMEDSVNDQSSAAANARRSSSILRYPLRSATKSKEEKPPAAELSTSAPKRGFQVGRSEQQAYIQKVHNAILCLHASSSPGASKVTVSLRYADLISVFPTRISVLVWPIHQSHLCALGSHSIPARLSYAEDALRTMSLPESFASTK